VLSLNPKDKIYWIKISFAIITALVCGFLGMTGVHGFLFGLLMLITAYYFSIFAVRREIEEVGGLGTVFFTGLFTYIFLWLVLWSLIYTVTIK